MPAPFDDRRQRWFDDACARISVDRMRDLLVGLVNIHSPTGAERDICAFLASQFAATGLDARCDAIGERSANCVARRRGGGDGPDLLLYAPVDTHLDADPGTDIPWAGVELRPDMLPRARVEDGAVIGLGAANPKSMVAAVVEAVRCMVEAGIPLDGDVIAAFCGGGMPWLERSRGGAGMSSGVRHMLARGVHADCGVIVKTWDDVYHEHPGLAWFRIDVIGSLGYAGVRGAADLRNPIIPAARLIAALDQWLVDYAQRHRSAEVHPQGAVSAVHAGWQDRPAFPPATASIYVDVRLTPDQAAPDVQRELAAFLADIRPHFEGFEIRSEMIGHCPGARTDPDHWIVGAGRRAWSEAHGRPHVAATPMSGQTDAAALTLGGIPTVRIGFPFGGDPRTPEALRDGLGGMGVTWPDALVTTVRQLLHIIVDTSTRSRTEIAAAGQTGGASE